jgi:hypothetical protein
MGTDRGVFAEGEGGDSAAATARCRLVADADGGTCAATCAGTDTGDAVVLMGVSVSAEVEILVAGGMFVLSKESAADCICSLGGLSAVSTSR